MKTSEFHCILKRNGWKHIRTDGSHDIYEKGGCIYPVPFHGAKEMGEGLGKKIIRDLGLK